MRRVIQGDAGGLRVADEAACRWHAPRLAAAVPCGAPAARRGVLTWGGRPHTSGRVAQRLEPF